MILTAVLFFSVITFGLQFVEAKELKTCAPRLTCTPLSRSLDSSLLSWSRLLVSCFIRCAYWCKELHALQVNQNLKRRALLKRATCNINAKGEASVCCKEDPEKVDRCLRCGMVQTNNDLRCIDCESSLPGQWPWMVRLLYRWDRLRVRG